MRKIFRKTAKKFRFLVVGGDLLAKAMEALDGIFLFFVSFFSSFANQIIVRREREYFYILNTVFETTSHHLLGGYSWLSCRVLYTKKLRTDNVSCICREKPTDQFHWAMLGIYSRLQGIRSAPATNGSLIGPSVAV